MLIVYDLLNYNIIPFFYNKKLYYIIFNTRLKHSQNKNIFNQRIKVKSKQIIKHRNSKYAISKIKTIRVRKGTDSNEAN